MDPAERTMAGARGPGEALVPQRLFEAGLQCRDHIEVAGGDRAPRIKFGGRTAEDWGREPRLLHCLAGAGESAEGSLELGTESPHSSAGLLWSWI